MIFEKTSMNCVGGNIIPEILMHSILNVALFCKNLAREWT